MGILDMATGSSFGGASSNRRSNAHGTSKRNLAVKIRVSVAFFRCLGLGKVELCWYSRARSGRID